MASAQALSTMSRRYFSFTPFTFTVFGFLLLAVPTYASTLPSGFSENLVARGFDTPTAMEFAPDGRLFVLEKGGNVLIIKSGELLTEPFVSLEVNSVWERGLLGIAFDPNYNDNRYVYLYYTTSDTIKNRVSRFTAQSANQDLAEVGSEKILVDNIPSDGGNHNGGAIHFGLDGKLYIAIGDGGVTHTNSQDLGSLSGKILRINPDGTIPSDNPYVGQNGKRPEIWAYGFRNPFTFAINPISGLTFINDVGVETWEEIDKLEKGGNYGWPLCEGNCSISGMVNPLYTYNHSVGHSITGGSFYEASQFPGQYKGLYFFSDYTADWIKTITESGVPADFAVGIANPVDLKVGPDGSLYYLTIGTISCLPSGCSTSGNSVYRIYYGSSVTPTPTPPVTPPTNESPVGTITLPLAGTTYKAGDTISYSGTGTDSEDGTLPDSAFSWTIEFHHDTHMHPFIGPIKGVKTGTFLIPTVGEASANVWYRILLTVTDSNGVTHTSYVDVLPQTVTITLTSVPPELQLLLDGQPVKSPYSFTSVVGFERSLSIPLVQTVNGKTFAFYFWSDNGSRTHTISIPSSDTSYEANFFEVKQGDANLDNKVDGIDYVIWFFHYGQATQNGCIDGDFNNDGKVDGADFSLWFSNYEKKVISSKNSTSLRKGLVKKFQ